MLWPQALDINSLSQYQHESSYFLVKHLRAPWPCLRVAMMVYICLVQGVALLEGLALLEEVCHCGCGLKTLTLAAWKSIFYQKPSDEDIEISALPAPCLLRGCHAPALMTMA